MANSSSVGLAIQAVILVGIAWSGTSPAVAVAQPSQPTETWGDAKDGFYLEKEDDALNICLDGQPIASYIYRHDQIKRPFFAHVKSPSGIQVTRNFPPAGDDPTDHADMHPGLWMAFGKVSGVDFWRNQGRIVHEDFSEKPTAGETASFTTLNRFESPEGKLVCRQRTAFTLAKDPAGYLISIEATFSADEPFAFGVQEEMGLGVRVATPLRVAGGNGAIVNSNGQRNEKQTWGKVANWWDYYGAIDDAQVGAMIMSSPGNPDVWSHSRDYGYLAANPFAVDIPENRQQKIVVKPGETFRLRYGVLVHECERQEDFDRAAAYRRYLDRMK